MRLVQHLRPGPHLAEEKSMSNWGDREGQVYARPHRETDHHVPNSLRQSRVASAFVTQTCAKGRDWGPGTGCHEDLESRDLSETLAQPL